MMRILVGGDCGGDSGGCGCGCGVDEGMVVDDGSVIEEAGGLEGQERVAKGTRGSRQMAQIVVGSGGVGSFGCMEEGRRRHWCSFDAV